MNPICTLEWNTKGQSKQKKPVCMCTQLKEHSLASPSASVQVTTTLLHLEPFSTLCQCAALSSPGWAKPEQPCDFCSSACASAGFVLRVLVLLRSQLHVPQVHSVVGSASNPSYRGKTAFLWPLEHL